MANQAKEQFCEYCGESMGVYVKPWGSHDTCGKPECTRYERDCEREAQEDAHRRLDDDNGWSQF